MCWIDGNGSVPALTHVSCDNRHVTTDMAHHGHQGAIMTSAHTRAQQVGDIHMPFLHMQKYRLVICRSSYGDHIRCLDSLEGAGVCGPLP